MSPLPPSTGKPVIVLVHGAFADTSSWNGVAAELLADGYPTLAVANPLRGVAHDAEHLRAVVEALDADVVLVGHSYGGMLISSTEISSDRVRALVFVAAFAPDTGESAADLAARFPGSTLGDTLAPVTLADGQTDLYIRHDRYAAQFAADVAPDAAAVMAVTQRPITGSALTEPADAPAWRTTPSWFIYGTEDRNIPVPALRFMAERACAHTIVEIEGGSHAIATAHAAAVADIIRDAATDASVPMHEAHDTRVAS